jgi:hypothetical protein
MVRRRTDRGAPGRGGDNAAAKAGQDVSVQPAWMIDCAIQVPHMGVGQSEGGAHRNRYASCNPIRLTRVRRRDARNPE